MSSVYVLEPPTSGKVILNTTEGPLDIELWPKEAPKAVRNFVQLCMDGYYDNTAFHRIIKDFMVQGGDRSGTGTGGESIYGAPFADEFHSRLRFNHRGLVACANPDTPNSNNSQFFITLSRCEWLDRKNTIFGKVTGDTVYNLMKIGEAETNKDDKPIDPPIILSTEVLWCPFDDMVPTRSLGTADTIVSEAVDVKNKTKKVKQLNLLSFGEEAEQEDQELANINVKIKSSHDVLNDPRLLKGDAETELDEIEEQRRKEVQASVKEALKKNNDNKEDKKSREGYGTDEEDDGDFDAAMRRQVLSKMKKFDEVRPPKQATGKSSGSERKPPPRSYDDDDDNDDGEGASLRREKLSLKKKGLGSEGRAGLLLKADVDAQLLGPLEQQRHVNKQKKRARQGREADTLEKLKQFESNLLKAKLDSSKSSNTDVEEESGWLTHRLQFTRDQQTKDNMARNDDPDQYVVHDPLLEKGKEKFNKMQAKMKRKEREWAGKSIT